MSEFRNILQLRLAGGKVSTELSDFLGGKHYTEWAEQVKICRKCGSKWREHMAWPTKGNDNDNDKDNESENVQKIHAENVLVRFPNPLQQQQLYKVSFPGPD